MQLPPFSGLNADQLPPEIRKPLDPMLKQLSSFLTAVSNGARKNFSFTDNLLAQLYTLRVTTPTTDWNYVGDSGQPGFISPWSNWGNSLVRASFRKLETGTVEIRGEITSTSGAAGGIFILPPIYRNTTNERQIFPVDSNNTYTTVEILNDGTVNSRLVTAAANFMSLNLSFAASNKDPLPFTCFPMSYASTLNVKTVGVWPIAAYALDANNPGVQDFTSYMGPVFVDWVESSQVRQVGGAQQVSRTIKVRNITGLRPGKSYRVTLLSIGG